MITLWQGSANKWDCDEMGHMNVRIYVEKAMEGLGVFAQAIDMPHAFRDASPSTLSVREHHIRYIREVHAGRPLRMQACVLDVGTDDAVIYQELLHADGTCAAAFRTRFSHTQTKTGRTFAWSARSRAALEALRDTPPTQTAPRSIPADGPILPDAEISRDIARKQGARLIGMGTVLPGQCDPDGNMRIEWFMGRMSDSVPNLLYGWREQVAETAGGKRMGAAVLEYRFIYRALPHAGDTFEIHGAFGDAGEKVHSLVYWMTDPISGRAWASCQAVAVTFDLDTRKTIKTAPEHIDLLKKIAPGDLKI